MGAMFRDMMPDDAQLSSTCGHGRESNGIERATVPCHQHPRGISVRGKHIDWGYEAPREGIREAIAHALQTP